MSTAPRAWAWCDVHADRQLARQRALSAARRVIALHPGDAVSAEALAEAHAAKAAWDRAVDAANALTRPMGVAS